MCFLREYDFFHELLDVVYDEEDPCELRDPCERLCEAEGEPKKQISQCYWLFRTSRTDSLQFSQFSQQPWSQVAVYSTLRSLLSHLSIFLGIVHQPLVFGPSPHSQHLHEGPFCLNLQVCNGQSILTDWSRARRASAQGSLVPCCKSHDAVVQKNQDIEAWLQGW